MISLCDLGGLWRRTLLAWPDGRTDTTSEVFWLQGPRRYADLRIPAGRPAADVACLRDLDWTMLRFMARQEGFFGELTVSDSVGYWDRVFDYRPDTGTADCGALVMDGNILIERGIEQHYTELWSRSCAGDDAMTLVLQGEAGALGCLVVAGDAFIYARGRATALPRGATLNELINGAASLQAAQDLFDCEISFGRRRAGGWHIERSSHSFREGATLAPALDSVAGLLTVGDVAPDGTPIKRTWRVIADEGVSPLSRCFGSDGADVMPLPSQREQDKTIETCGAAR